MPYFIWNGVNSDTLGIIVEEETPIIRAEERVTHVIIPGRPGDLTTADGEAEFAPYLQTVRAYVPMAAAQAIGAARGDGYVTFSTQPDFRQRARLISQMNFDYPSKNLGGVIGDILFYCQPLKGLTNEAETTVTFGQTLTNAGDVTEKPLITLTGTGGMTVCIDGKTLTITGITEEQGGAIIDTENMTVTAKLTGEIIGAQTVGDFPVIPVGIYPVTFTGATCKIGRRQRWI